MMKRWVATLLLAGGVIPASATNYSFNGNFANGDEVAFFSFTVGASSNITVKSLSYAGGINAAGDAIPQGGFDPMAFIFDKATGKLLGGNDDEDLCVNAPKDAVTGMCWDAFFQVTSLPAGEYGVAVVQYNRWPNGPSIYAGFKALSPEYMKFIDNKGHQRTSAWAVDILGVESADFSGSVSAIEPTAVPVVGIPALILSAFSILGAFGYTSRRRR